MDSNDNNTIYVLLFFLLNKEMQICITRSPVDSENLFSYLHSLVISHPCLINKSEGPPEVEIERT